MIFINPDVLQMTTLVDDILSSQIMAPLMTLATSKINAFIVHVTSKIGSA